MGEIGVLIQPANFWFEFKNLFIIIWAVVKIKMVTQEKLNKLFWHSRRGMLELDLILVPFVREHYANINEADQLLYDKLLESEDQDLFAWFMQSDFPKDPEIAKIVSIILATRPQV